MACRKRGQVVALRLIHDVTVDTDAGRRCRGGFDPRWNCVDAKIRCRSVTILMNLGGVLILPAAHRLHPQTCGQQVTWVGRQGSQTQRRRGRRALKVGRAWARWRIASVMAAGPARKILIILL